MKTVLSCLLLGFSMMVHASDDSSMDVNLTAPSFVVTLPANPTTGYQWSVVTYDKKLLKLNGSVYQRPKTKLIGAGGQIHFTFMLVKNKSYPTGTEIVFKYARSWEPASATLKKVKVNFVKK